MKVAATAHPFTEDENCCHYAHNKRNRGEVIMETLKAIKRVIAKRQGRGATDTDIIAYLEHLEVVHKLCPELVAGIEGLITIIREKGGQDER